MNENKAHEAFISISRSNVYGTLDNYPYCKMSEAEAYRFDSLMDWLGENAELAFDLIESEMKKQQKGYSK